jgi:YidC/Oxa1 family membrane protein insertase
MANGYFAEVGFIADAQSGPAPGPDTVWSAAPGQTLTPTTPVTLTYDNGAGLVFTRVIWCLPAPRKSRSSKATRTSSTSSTLT